MIGVMEICFSSFKACSEQLEDYTLANLCTMLIRIIHCYLEFRIVFTPSARVSRFYTLALAFSTMQAFASSIAVYHSLVRILYTPV